MVSRHLDGIIDISISECMSPLLEGAEERIRKYFWDTVECLQEDVLHGSTDIILKDNAIIKANLDKILDDFRLSDINHMSGLREKFEYCYLNLKAEVYHILRQNTSTTTTM